MKKISDLKTWEDGINQVICGDCLELMKMMPDKCVDLVLTDPPYGITNAKWDKLPSREYFDEIFRISKEQLFFGGQFFDLPKKEGWLIWYYKPYWMNKQFTRNKKGLNEANLIWISLPIKTKVVEYHISGNIEGFRGEKLKPNYKKTKQLFTSEKPVRLVKYLIETYFENTDTIFDPFLGSGTTCVAAKQLGRCYIGIEIELKYCEIARQRLRQGILL